MQTGVSQLETTAPGAEVRSADIESPSFRVEKGATVLKQAYRDLGSKMDQESKSLEDSVNRGSEKSKRKSIV